MSMIEQIFWGGLVLGVCLILESAMLVWCGQVLRSHERRFPDRLDNLRRLGGVLISTGFVVAAHTAQVWIWSAALMVKAETFSDWNTAVYFSVATYTTLGYGDVVLDSDHRIFASFAAMNGMLAFGISTAFLVSTMRTVFSNGVKHSGS
ncbi:potassium channel family protein [Phaeobacter sp. B1627]|uniref:potassium channel family protein n=1 Tax=Phaeobacter sp. B1627 TaxID=2583809 RepID=UPI00111901A6|nr:potassium channel family protein [Phaeobacter sp. B1627]TNJ46849.1 two pore domain potassium channel family protein [Phaeobacter sp. B1627]